MFPTSDFFVPNDAGAGPAGVFLAKSAWTGIAAGHRWMVFGGQAGVDAPSGTGLAEIEVFHMDHGHMRSVDDHLFKGVVGTMKLVSLSGSTLHLLASSGQAFTYDLSTLTAAPAGSTGG